MILAIDIGNTNIALGAFSDGQLRFTSTIATVTVSTADEYAAKLSLVFSLYGEDVRKINGAIISSVVPKLNSVMKAAVKTLTGRDALTVGPGIKTGIGIRCDDPASVGADLICASVAANALYGAPALIADMGTATKITVIDKTGAFAGLSIMAGVQMSADALSSGTAQLPQVSLDAPAAAIGKNTADCIRSGIIYGHAAMLDGMIDRISEEHGEDFRLIATGGYAEKIIGHCKHSFTVDKTLVLRGLEIIYRKNVK